VAGPGKDQRMRVEQATSLICKGKRRQINTVILFTTVQGESLRHIKMLTL